MTRPDPTVTVPVEPTEAMLDAWHKATWPQGPRVSPLSQQGLSFARAYRAMLSAAPAAPQAAGVGALVGQIDALLAIPDENLSTRVPHLARELLERAASQLRAPSREPEGGAVWFGAKDYEPTDAMIDAGEYHNHRHNPLTNLVASFKAMMEQAEIDGLVSCAPALATREEAPASHVSDRYKFDDEIAWLREAARYFSARDTQGEDRAHWANVYNAENARKLADRLAELSSNPCQLEAPAEAGERDKRAWIDRWNAIEAAARDALHTMNELLEAPNLKRMQYALAERRDALSVALNLPEAGTAWMRPTALRAQPQARSGEGQ